MLDFCFMRTDTGYDIMMLAVRNRDGSYRIYRLDGSKPAEGPLFEEKNPDRLRERIREWCRDHLPDDMAMMRFTVPASREKAVKVKKFLRDHNIPFEMKNFTFYVRKREFQRIKKDLEKLVASGN